MGEMAANILMGGKFVGYSAGSKPTGSVNNAALDIAKEIRYPLSKLQSKSITPFMSCENHSFDYAITVCDNAKDSCPIFTNCSKILHWGYSDPADIEDFDDRKQELLRIYNDIGIKLNDLLKKN